MQWRSSRRLIRTHTVTFSQGGYHRSRHLIRIHTVTLTQIGRHRSRRLIRVHTVQRHLLARDESSFLNEASNALQNLPPMERNIPMGIPVQRNATGSMVEMSKV